MLHQKIAREDGSRLLVERSLDDAHAVAGAAVEALATVVEPPARDSLGV